MNGIIKNKKLFQTYDEHEVVKNLIKYSDDEAKEKSLISPLNQNTKIATKYCRMFNAFIQLNSKCQYF